MVEEHIFLGHYQMPADKLDYSLLSHIIKYIWEN